MSSEETRSAYTDSLDRIYADSKPVTRRIFRGYMISAAMFGFGFFMGANAIGGMLDIETYPWAFGGAALVIAVSAAVVATIRHDRKVRRTVYGEQHSMSDAERDQRDRDAVFEARERAQRQCPGLRILVWHDPMGFGFADLQMSCPHTGGEAVSAEQWGSEHWPDQNIQGEDRLTLLRVESLRTRSLMSGVSDQDLDEATAQGGAGRFQVDLGVEHLEECGVHPDNTDAIESLTSQDWWTFDASSPEVALALSMSPNP